MCAPASFVLTKDRVFWSMRTDHHTKIIEEFKLHEDGVRGVNLVKIEIVPPGDDMRLPLDQWVYRLDQDQTPDWYDAEQCERRGRASLKEWASARLFIDIESVTVTGNTSAYCYGNSSTVMAYDSSTVRAYGSSTVMAYDSSTVRAYGSSTVRAYGSSTVRAYGSSTVTAYGSSTVMAYDSSTVRAYGSSTVMAYGSSTVRAYDSSTVTAYGSSTVTAYDSSTVMAYDSSTVMACENNSTVRHYATTEPVVPDGPHAVVIDSRGKESVCTVGT